MKWIHILSIGAALTAPVVASTIQIDFQAADQRAVPGTTIVYSADLANLTMTPIDLGSASVTVGGDLVADPALFLSGPATLPANTRTGVFDIFALTIPAHTPTGSIFPGLLTITDLGDNVLGTAEFRVQTVPEPLPLPLVGAGLAALLCVRSKRYLWRK